MKIKVKPLSVNDAWKGRRFKTEDYEVYEKELFYLLPNGLQIGSELYVEFGFSSSASDIDNPLKPLLDILQKKYGFNDKLIEKLTIVKKTVPKGEEYIDLEFTSPLDLSTA